ncbi:MAG: MoxR family ATPase, partial [Acidobacteria bacterium]|nr:MoxR family ATPase [Acidobacteriota bacterium]
MTEKNIDYVLKEIGLYGYEKIEDIILAAIVTGDPLLLVGTHGTAKTMLCERLARALGLKFIAYDASKALFEDVLGFPNPYSMQKGEIDYISTPISIQGKEFVLIDEISRANYQLQGKWLEIIRSRKIMGRKIDGLKFIFGAMNPPSYLGARTLDPALSGRFAFVVKTPEFPELNDDAKEKVLNNIAEDDAVVLNGSAGRRDYSSGSILNLIEKSRSLFLETEEKHGKSVSAFVMALEKHLTSENYVFDGRRAGMVKRSLIAVLSVKSAKSIDVVNNFPSIVEETLPYLLPYSVEADNFEPAALSLIIENLCAEFFGASFQKEKSISENYTLNNLISMIEKETDAERKIRLIRKLYALPLNDEVFEKVAGFHLNYFKDINKRSFNLLFSEGGFFGTTTGIKFLS